MELLSARRGGPHSEPQSARKNVRFAHLVQLALVEFFNLKLTNYYERLAASTSM